MTRLSDLSRSFVHSEAGSAAVDWVVMTAATVALGLAVMSEVSDAVEGMASRVATRLGDMPIRTSFEDWAALRADLSAEAEGGADTDG